MLFRAHVKRNADRFPKDFMFQISADEWQSLKYKIGTLKTGHVKPTLKYWMEPNYGSRAQA
jgi:hypothetical protein